MATSGGTYQVTVTDANNCTSSSSINVVVNNPPTATVASNSPVCVGTSIALTASGGISYTWSGPNGYTSIDQNPVITNVQTTSSGAYQVTVTDAQSCTNTASILVSVLPKPFAIISSNSPVCIGSDLRLQLSGGISYLWSGPLNFSSITQNPIISGSTTANSGVYQAIVTGQNGCTTTVTTDVIISGQLTINPNYNQPVCEGDTIKLFTGNGASFRWNGPTGFISLLQNPIIPNATLQNEGAYLLTVSDISGCSGTATVQVDVQENPQAVIEGDTTICLHGELELTSPTIGTKTWSTGANTNTITVSPSDNTIYTLTVDLNGCIDTTSHEVGVMPLPDLSIHVDQQTIEKGQSARLEATGGVVFHWSPSVGLSCTACNITIASPQNTTSYCVEAEQNGCLADTCVQIIVNEACAIVLANIFSPNGDTNNALWCSPAKDCIANQALWIYDRWGNLLFTGEGTDVCWDGTYSGKILQDQVCTYILRLTYTNGDLKHHTGTITLLH
jgi:gliding motility-associated-like protein